MKSVIGLSILFRPFGVRFPFEIETLGHIQEVPNDRKLLRSRWKFKSILGAKVQEKESVDNQAAKNGEEGYHTSEGQTGRVVSRLVALRLSVFGSTWASLRGWRSSE
jgi:hypothetical protein